MWRKGKGLPQVRTVIFCKQPGFAYPKDIITRNDVGSTCEIFGDGIIFGNPERLRKTHLCGFDRFSFLPFPNYTDSVTRSGNSYQIDLLIYHFVMYHLFIYLAIEQFSPPFSGVLYMIDIEHRKT